MHPFKMKVAVILLSSEVWTSWPAKELTFVFRTYTEAGGENSVVLA